MTIAAAERIAEVVPVPALLSGLERRSLALRLTLAMAAAGLLVIALAIDLTFPAQRDVANLLAGIAAALFAGPAFAAAWQSLRHPDLHGITDQLIALALIAAWATGDLVTAALLPMAMTIGHILEERSLLGSQEAIEALGRLSRATARRLNSDESTEDVAAEALRVGDRILLSAGDRNPADGIVRHGRAALDTAPITGESVPVEVAEGDAVFAGSIDLDGHLVVEVTNTGSATTLGKVIALMQSAERAKPALVRLLDRYAGRYTLLVLLLAAGTWFVSNDSAAMLAVLVASCPCALVLAAPATAIAAITVASRHGILIKGSAFLEELANVNSVILDKTGTVTLGELRIVAVTPAAGISDRELLRLAGSLGAASHHPVSRALAAASPPAERLAIENVRETPGRGIVARCGGERVAVGRAEFLSELGVALPSVPPHDGPLAGAVRGGRFLGWLLLGDEPRQEARQALADLRRLGLQRQILMTGDRRAVAERIAAQLQISDVVAQALPDEKMQRVIAEIAAGYRPMVVGDGINDSLALKAGAIGIAMGAQGTDVALASADLVLMSSDLRRLGTCIRLSRACRRTIAVNVGMGLGWTLVIVGCAAAGLLGASGALVAAVLHNLSTLAVIGNAGRLLRFDETRLT
ncbi:MAG TPA: cation-translocating P-type ATPase [Stellaceae bacterium]|nr:cation-translocating P-type ATPase [Stellaceae bacterium]